MAEKESAWAQELRDFKIDIVSGDRKLEIAEKAKLRFARELRFVAERFPEDVITGSLALNLYGLIDRKIGDIDIMIADRSRFSGYRQGLMYGEPKDGEMKLSNRLGYIEFRESGSLIRRLLGRSRTWEVDFFETPSAKFVEFEFEGKMFRVHDAISVVETKCELEQISMTRVRYSYDESADSPKQKHSRDLMCIFG